MYCPECGHVNPDSAKFCMKCGYNYGRSQDEESGVLIEEEASIPLIKSFDSAIEFKGHSGRAIAISPDGRWLASATGYHPVIGRFGSDSPFSSTVAIWDLRDWRLACSLKGHSGVVTSIAFSPDGEYLASGSTDRTVKIWEVDSWSECGDVTDHKNNVNAVAFSPNSKLLAMAGNYDGIGVWDTNTGRRFRSFGSGWTQAITFSPDGHRLVSGEQYELRWWDVGHGGEIGSIKVPHYGVYALVFHPKGHYLALCNTFGAFVFDTERMAFFHAIEESNVESIAFSPNGRIFTCAVRQVGIIVYDVTSWEVIQILPCVAMSLAFSPDGRFLASGCEMNSIALWFNEPLDNDEQAKIMMANQKAQEEERKKKESLQAERLKAQRREMGQCEVCGVKLGFLEKAGGNVRCKAHRY